MVAIAEWAHDVGLEVLAAAGVADPGREMPSESTVRRALQVVDPDNLAARVGAWALNRAGVN